MKWAKSPRSMSATDAPRPASEAAVTAPLMPPPIDEGVERAVAHPSQVRVAELHQATTTMTPTMLATLTITGVA